MRSASCGGWRSATRRCANCWEGPMLIDDPTRSRLRALADAERTELDAAAAERVRARLVREGPAEVARARRKRVVLRTGVGVLAAAAALVIGVRYAGAPAAERAAAPAPARNGA